MRLPRRRDFLLLWLGQVVSLFGSGLTGFALGVWIFERTGEVTDLALVSVSSSVPGLLMLPFAGVVVDRFPRRSVLLASDGGAALVTALLLALLVLGRLELLYLHLLVAAGAVMRSLQMPAFQASITLLVPRERFGQASGFLQLGLSSASILAPLAAGALLAVVDIRGVILVDLVTFLVAVALLLLVRIPPPPAPEVESESETAAEPEPGSEAAAGGAVAGAWGRLLHQAAFGWRYLRRRPAMLRLVLLFAGLNFAAGLALVLVTPLVLSFAGAAQLGVVLAVGSAGTVLGSLATTLWGGPARRVRAVVTWTPLVGLALVGVGLRPQVLWIAAALLCFHGLTPLINAANQAFWLERVEPAIQGRVFATLQLIGRSTAPVAYLLAGPLSDGWFEPWMASGGALAGALGPLLGTGPGRGIGLLYGVVGLGVVALGLAVRSDRRLLALDRTPGSGEAGRAP